MVVRITHRAFHLSEPTSPTTPNRFRSSSNHKEQQDMPRAKKTTGEPEANLTVLTPVEDQEPEQPTEPETTPTGRLTVARRRDLREQYGLKQCSVHMVYLDRLPDEYRAPVDGQTDPALRPLAEFNKGIAACKQCAGLRQKERTRQAQVRKALAIVHTEVTEHEQSATEE